jgi:hypothetical protein
MTEDGGKGQDEEQLETSGDFGVHPVDWSAGKVRRPVVLDWFALPAPLWRTRVGAGHARDFGGTGNRRCTAQPGCHLDQQETGDFSQAEKRGNF